MNRYSLASLPLEIRRWLKSAQMNEVDQRPMGRLQRQSRSVRYLLEAAHLLLAPSGTDRASVGSRTGLSVRGPRAVRRQREARPVVRQGQDGRRPSSVPMDRRAEGAGGTTTEIRRDGRRKRHASVLVGLVWFGSSLQTKPNQNRLQADPIAPLATDYLMRR